MAKEKSVLKSIEKKVEVKVTENHSPKEFFKDRKGLYVWNSFINNIVENAKETKAGKEFKLDSFELLKTAWDEEIEKDLPKKHIFSETDVCAIIASLIEKQPKREEGTLLNNGYLNIFYTPSLVVFVYWDDGEWFVRDWLRGYYWAGGSRVFSPATES